MRILWKCRQRKQRRERTKINSCHLLWLQSGAKKKKKYSNPYIYLKRQQIFRTIIFSPLKEHKNSKISWFKKSSTEHNVVPFCLIESFECVLHFAYRTVFAATTCACGLNGMEKRKNPHLKWTYTENTPFRRDKLNFPHNVRYIKIII